MIAVFVYCNICKQAFVSGAAVEQRLRLFSYFDARIGIRRESIFFSNDLFDYIACGFFTEPSCYLFPNTHKRLSCFRIDLLLFRKIYHLSVYWKIIRIRNGVFRGALYLFLFMSWHLYYLFFSALLNRRSLRF